MVRPWQRHVGVHLDVMPDDEADRPGRVFMVAVSSVRSQFADADGSHCYPALNTVAELSGCSRSTVQRVDRWLIKRGLMEPVRRRQHSVIEYQLTMSKVPAQRSNGSPVTYMDAGTGSQESMDSLVGQE